MSATSLQQRDAINALLRSPDAAERQLGVNWALVALGARPSFLLMRPVAAKWTDLLQESFTSCQIKDRPSRLFWRSDNKDQEFLRKARDWCEDTTPEEEEPMRAHGEVLGYTCPGSHLNEEGLPIEPQNIFVYQVSVTDDKVKARPGGAENRGGAWEVLHGESCPISDKNY